MNEDGQLLTIDDEADEDEVLVRFDIATYPSDYTLGGIL